MRTTIQFKTALLTVLVLLSLGFKASAQYTLTDDDVVVIEGLIDTCTYDFAITDIIIPDTLDGQVVTGIADKIGPAGVFQNKGITSLELPLTIRTIGNYAFAVNKLDSFDFSFCPDLAYIGVDAFGGNNLTNLDLSSCSSLTTIARYAFVENKLTSIDLSDCSSLMYIKERAFFYNPVTSIDFSACTSLIHIGERAFFYSSLTSIDLSTCTALTTIGDEAFRNNSLTDIDLSNCSVLSSIGTRAFQDNLLTSLDFSDCLALDSIGEDAFLFNSLSSLDLDSCISLTTIGPGAFTGNKLTHVDFSSCAALTTIGDHAFSSNSLTSIDLSACAALTYIEDNAFGYNSLQSIDFSACTALTYIGNSAFFDNPLASIDLSALTALTFIGTSAFFNDSIQNYTLPVNTKYEDYGWVSATGNTYDGGDIVSKWSFYYVPAPYTLADNDVEISEGIIQSCSYNFELGVIVIPDTLDGQPVLGIAYKKYPETIFQSKGITELSLPSTIVSVADEAFIENSILKLDLNSCASLSSIGSLAFSSNSLKVLDFSGCTDLTSIGRQAFSSNRVEVLDLSACANLAIIEEDAFSKNNIYNIDLSACTALTFIGESAFRDNPLSNYALPTHALFEAYGWKDVNGDTYIGGDTVSDLSKFYYVPAPYTLTDDDVEVTEGIIQSCSYDFGLKEIIIPDTLDGQKVTGIADRRYPEKGVFNNKGITAVDLPSTMETFGEDAFTFNYLSTLDLSECSALTSIGNSAFAYNRLTNIDLSDSSALTSIGSSAFSRNELTTFDFGACPALTSIGVTAFRSNNLTSIDLSECTTLTTIRTWAFISNEMTSFQLPTPNIPGEVFENWIDGNNNVFAGGDSVSDLLTSFTAIFFDTVYTVTFTIADGSNPIQDAAVTLSGYGTVSTNETGVALFGSVGQENDIAYTITAMGYQEASGTLTVVDVDVSEAVTLIPIPTYTVNFSISDGTDPIQDANVTLTGHGTVTSDAFGLAAFSDVSPEEDMAYTVTATDFLETTGMISVVDTDVNENITLIAVTGISPISENQFRLYPNPAKDMIHLHIDENALVRIMDVSGRVVLLKEVSKGSTPLSVAHLKAGSYLIKVETEKGVITRQIMVEQ